MIKSNLSPPPTFPATFWDLVPFLCAGGLALLFTALLVLLVEDDSGDGKMLGEQQSQFAHYPRRLVGLSEKEREWSARSHSSYYGYSPVQKDTTSSPASPTVTMQMPHYQRPVFPKRLFAVPPSATSPAPTQAPTAPMLSMAKLIMHRHDQATRRARQARAQRQQLAAQQQSQAPSHTPARTSLRL